MATTGIKIYNLFRQDGMGYRMYLASFSTRKKAESERLRLVKQGRGFYKKSELIIRVGKLQ